VDSLTKYGSGDGSADPEDWSDVEYRLFQGLEVEPDDTDDVFIRMAYDVAFFSPGEDYQSHVEFRRYLINTLSDKYGIDFESAFDWDEYRERGESRA
jgi:hypothetical protein